MLVTVVFNIPNKTRYLSVFFYIKQLTLKGTSQDRFVTREIPELDARLLLIVVVFTREISLLRQSDHPNFQINTKFTMIVATECKS